MPARPRAHAVVGTTGDRSAALATMRIVAFGLVGLILLAVVVTVVQQARNSKPWPLKRHEGHWRKWDDDED